MGGVASIPTDPSKKVQVISAGYSRTDYCSTWIKAYDAREAGDKELTLKLVRKATAGFVATADLPPSDFMPEMMELYPDAKVVLVRRDPEKWWNSIATLTSRTTPWWLGAVLAPIPGWRYLAKFASVYSRSTLRLAGLENKDASPTDLIEKGGPRVPIPDEPFPRANDSKAADEYATKVLLGVLKVWVGIFSTIGLTAYSATWLWRNI
ncbi:hypothetical protein ABKA04_003176 [Annulohypoxylon sp. FPYF3050]